MSSADPPDDSTAALDRVAEELYALPPEDFTAARDALAKAQPAIRKAVAALRKPTVAAWLVNQLSRQDPDLLGQLLDLGPALAEAQRAGAGADLRTLSDQRRALLGAVGARAVELGGRDVSASVRLEVEATLDAALADPAAADAVRCGRLVRSLSFAGFGGVDLGGATATPSTVAARPRVANPKEAAASSAADEERLAAVAAAEDAAHGAAGVLDDAVHALSTAQSAAGAAEAETRAADEEVGAAAAALEAARERRTEAGTAERAAGKAVTDAERRVARAQKAAERARDALDQLRRA